MNIDAVRSLLLALDLGSLTAAAARLEVPPSTVSRRVRELENELGHEVLARTGRGVRPAAPETIAKLRDVLHAVDACYEQPPPISRLRVTAPVQMAMTLLPSVLPGYHERFPHVVVVLRGDDRLVGLVEEEFDLAFRGGALPDSNYLSRILPSKPFVVVAAPQLAARIDGVSALEQTSTVEVAGPPPGLSGTWDGTPFRLRSSAIARVDSFTAALPLVLAGHAYMSAPYDVVVDLVRDGDLVQLDGIRLDRGPVRALYPRRHRTQAAVMGFIDAVTDVIDAMT